MKSTIVELNVWGPHVCEEALNSKYAEVHEIFVMSDRNQQYEKLMQLARSKKVPTRMVGRDKIFEMAKDESHQNVAARVSLNTMDSMREWAESRPDANGKSCSAIAMDSIQDPQNVGALLRSAHFFGAAFALMTRDRSASLTGSVAKASAGALFSLPIIRAVNLAREIETAAELGFFCVGLDAEASEALHQMNLAKRDVMLVVGNEGEGLRNLTKKNCDTLARLSKVGYRDSLNASASGAVALYEIARQHQV